VSKILKIIRFFCPKFIKNFTKILCQVSASNPLKGSINRWPTTIQIALRIGSSLWTFTRSIIFRGCFLWKTCRKWGIFNLYIYSTFCL